MGLKTCTPTVLPQASLNSVLEGSKPLGEGCPFLRNSRCPFLRNSAFLGGVEWAQQFHRLSLDKLEISNTSSEVRASSTSDGASELPFSHRIKPASGAALEQLRLAGSDRYTRAKSVIMVVGLSFRTAPVELREKLAIPEGEWPHAIAELCNHNHIEEAAVLSTCNRMEIYVVALSWHRGVVEVLEWMSKKSGVSTSELRDHLFMLRDRDAYQHLFKVSSGLDSLVLGEGQILSQVKQVLKTGQGCVGFGRNMSGLFKQAITAGKRVRSETGISAGAVSISSAAVELAILKLSRKWFTSARVLVVGAGKMAKLLIKHLESKGCTSMVVVNRSEQKVLDLEAEFPEVELLYQPLSELMRCAGESDLIFTSTASDIPLFSKEAVEQLEHASDKVGGIRAFVDIAVPRNVDAGVAAVPSTRVYNVDDLNEVVAANKEDRRREALEAQKLIDEELVSFESWRDSLETVPTIKKLRAYAERIRASEMQKCLSRLSEDVSGKDKKLVEELSRGIVNKLLHGPMQHLRSDGSGGRSMTETIDNMHAVERMFDLKADFASIEQQLRTQLEQKPQ